MGKNKLRKFSEMNAMECVLQYPFAVLQSEGGFPLRGKWCSERFAPAPLVLELGCGKGEYAVGLARRQPGSNFVGIDIKGARMYTGARQATEEGLPNVTFLRTGIELLEHFFAPGEVSEIWITFPDPQMKKTRKRLTSTTFLQRYRNVMKPGGLIRLKTDSPFLYTYTRRLLEVNGITPQADVPDLYAPDAQIPPEMAPIMDIRTYYEQQWLSRGLNIKYLSFRLPDGDAPLIEPETDDIPLDGYRSTRGRGSNPMNPE